MRYVDILGIKKLCRKKNIAYLCNVENKEHRDVHLKNTKSSLPRKLLNIILYILHEISSFLFKYRHTNKPNFCSPTQNDINFLFKNYDSLMKHFIFISSIPKNSSFLFTH